MATEYRLGPGGYTKVEIDLSGVGRLISGISNALIGTGGKGDLADVVVDETRLLAQECGSAPTKSQRSRIDRSIGGDIGKVFMRKPAKPFTGKKKGSGDITWLYAGPGFLVGANKDRIMSGSQPSAMKPILRTAHNRLPRQKFLDAGRIEGGSQHAMLVQRFLAPVSAIKKLARELKKRVGKRDASFAETSEKLGGKVPAGSANHFPTGKNITDPHIIGDSPSITFGSKAVGVSGLAPKVQKSVKVREKKMARKLNLILTGYARQNSSGRPITKGAKP
jgi:hypothetical protein